eukprot:gb/GECH01011698.1/.p1 GENE.gb/GECH01011698.1/~~gb/GECH01011698.1/.p1  ORF type:complete len:394 (+),score=83.69 gb/GECH01011698.1/:1-1182(+)
MSNDHTPFEHFGTDAIHAGQQPDPHSGAVITPISLSTTFAQTSPGVKYPGGYEYSRSGNPTRDALQGCIAKLENATHGFAFSSGLGCNTTIMHMLKAGDHVVCMDDLYGGSARYFSRCASNFDLSFDFVDLTNPKNLEGAIKKETKLVWMETPTNPTLKLVDIAAVCEIAHRHNLTVVVDNTFMSPYCQRPLDLGADMVVHSATKYLGGHSDVVMGIVCTKDQSIAERLGFLVNAIGTCPSAFDSFLVLRSLKTLHVRMRQHVENAMAVARALESHANVERVIYPGLESHPQHDIAKKQTRAFGGMVTVILKGGESEARTFLENVRVFTLAESLGGVESLAEHPAIMTHASVPPERRKELGISDSLIRLSVGIEDTDDLVNDVTNALNAISSS